MAHFRFVQPIGEIARDVSRAIVAEQTRLVRNCRLIAARSLQGEVQRVGHIFGFPCFTSAGPGLCPFVPDVVEVRTVWGQVFKSVPCGFDQGFVSPRLWKVARSITDTVLEGSPGIRSCSRQRLKMSASTLASVNPTHNKTPAGSAPMTLTRPLAFQSCCPGQPRGSPGAALSTRCIPIGAGHVMGKTTLVDIDNGPGIALISINLFPKPPFPETPAARPGLLSGASGLFYMSRPVCQAPAIWPSVSHQTAQRDRIGRRQDGLSPPAQASPGRSFGPSDARGAWEQSAWPNA